MPLVTRRENSFIDPTTEQRAVGVNRHIAETLVHHIESAAFPCPVAKTATANNALCVGVYNSTTSEDDIHALYVDVKKWLTLGYKGDFRTFVAMYTDDFHPNHDEYHNALWSTLSRLRKMEPAQSTVPKGTSEHIEDDDFAFSIHNAAFFVVGLSPTSPRFSRRTAFPGFALNLHEQFELLRHRGQMARIEQQSRKRDTALQGGVNPLLMAHGKSSAALQYSAKAVSSTSECPYKH